MAVQFMKLAHAKYPVLPPSKCQSKLFHHSQSHVTNAKVSGLVYVYMHTEQTAEPPAAQTGHPMVGLIV